MAYRKRSGRDAWHFYSNCSNWPKSGYQTRSTKPTSGELCNECLAKRRNGDCK